VFFLVFLKKVIAFFFALFCFRRCSRSAIRWRRIRSAAFVRAFLTTFFTRCGVHVYVKMWKNASLHSAATRRQRLLISANRVSLTSTLSLCCLWCETSPLAKRLLMHSLLIQPTCTWSSVFFRLKPGRCSSVMWTAQAQVIANNFLWH